MVSGMYFTEMESNYIGITWPHEFEEDGTLLVSILKHSTIETQKRLNLYD